MAPEEEEVGPKIAFLKNNSWQDRYPQLNTFLICTLYILCHFTIFYQNAIPDTTRRQVYGKFTIANTELREHQVHVFFSNLVGRSQYCQATGTVPGLGFGTWDGDGKWEIESTPSSRR